MEPKILHFPFCQLWEVNFCEDINCILGFYFIFVFIYSGYSYLNVSQKYYTVLHIKENSDNNLPAELKKIYICNVRIWPNAYNFARVSQNHLHCPSHVVLQRHDEV